MHSLQRVAVFGATGSIGASALDVIARHPQQLQASVLAAGSNVDALLALCRTHRPAHAVIADDTAFPALRDGLQAAGLPTQAHAGMTALDELAASDACDSVVAAIVGAAGLSSTLAAVRAGKRLLLANKESLVMAGALVMQAARQSGAVVIPIDSEHNALLQCLPAATDGVAQASAWPGVARIVLTASGGPFRGRSRAQLTDITPQQAIAHPKWSMGPKISVDSATLMNKGLEVIEAHHLFGLSAQRIGVLVHPQSLVHALVEYADGSTLAQLGLPDMRTALAVGFAWPQRIASGVAPLDLLQHRTLQFEPPDLDTFPCLQLAYAALERGGTASASLNALNEATVSAFLQGRIAFLDIPRVLQDGLERLPVDTATDLAQLQQADAAARRHADAVIARLPSR